MQHGEDPNEKLLNPLSKKVKNRACVWETCKTCKTCKAFKTYIKHIVHIYIYIYIYIHTYVNTYRQTNKNKNIQTTDNRSNIYIYIYIYGEYLNLSRILEMDNKTYAKAAFSIFLLRKLYSLILELFIQHSY